MYDPVLNSLYNLSEEYTRLSYPQPAFTHRNYPLFTPGSHDLRWAGLEEIEENGLHWVGGLMFVIYNACVIWPSHEVPWFSG